MKATLTKGTTDRSLERRWDLTDAQPVLAHPLRPSVEFVPVDLRIWWQKSDGGRREESCSSNAWPAKGQDRDRIFASWDAGGIPAAMPAWVRELAAVVRADLDANLASEHDGTDFWGYGNDRRWALEDAPLVADRSGIEFIPAELDISHSFYPENSSAADRDHRYSVYAYSAGRGDFMSVQWGGTRQWQDRHMPGWVRELVDAQYEDLAAAARASTAERENR